MRTPQFEIDRLNNVLNGENIEFLGSSVAFGVASCVVEYADPELLVSFPQWVRNLVFEMCEVYQREGGYYVISSLGEKDHSEMVAQLAILVNPDRTALESSFDQVGQSSS